MTDKKRERKQVWVDTDLYEEVSAWASDEGAKMRKPMPISEAFRELVRAGLDAKEQGK